jgi:protein kinase X
VPSQKPPSTNSITFSSTVTIQGLFSKKSDDTADTNTVASWGNHDAKNWLAHQEQLDYWNQQPSVFEQDVSLTKNVKDYKLLDTLGKQVNESGAN